MGVKYCRVSEVRASEKVEFTALRL